MTGPGAPLLTSLEARVEAAIFAAGRAVSEKELREVIPAGADLGPIMASIAKFWSTRGIRLEGSSEGWFFKADQTLLPQDNGLSSRRLSTAAIATLATIAMHTPATVAQIEKVRGVKVARPIIDSLVDAGLIAEVGRGRGAGKAVAYGVTELFLQRFGLRALADLPTSEEAFLLDLDGG